MNDKAREAFEAHAVKNWCHKEDLKRGARTGYVERELNEAWKGWNAALQWVASQQAAEGWRPISEAPKELRYSDGHNHYSDYILAWWPGALAVTRVRWWWRDDSGASNFLADGGYAVFPSVWQHLPAAPTAQGERDEQ